MNQEIRWQQRFDNYLKAFSTLEEAVRLVKQRGLSDLERQGLIQSFEFTHELAWNVLKDYLEDQGVFNLVGSRDTSREAFNRGLISHGNLWMEMIKSRNLSTHTYSKKISMQLFEQITEKYFSCFLELKIKMQSLVKNDRN